MVFAYIDIILYELWQAEAVKYFQYFLKNISLFDLYNKRPQLNLVNY